MDTQYKDIEREAYNMYINELVEETDRKMMNRPPKWLYQQDNCNSAREWKQLKRKQLEFVLDVLSDYNLGCAYCPESIQIEQIREKLLIVKEALKVKNWGR